MAFFLRIALLCSVLAHLRLDGHRSIVRDHRSYTSTHASVDALGAIDLMGVSDASAVDFPTAMDIRNAKPLRLQKEM
jgi:hypothetical protein